jgi:hypothetical protein
MALPIKKTPTLEGKDAIRFTKSMKNVETKSISKEEYDIALSTYNEIVKNNVDLHPAFSEVLIDNFWELI